MDLFLMDLLYEDTKSKHSIYSMCKQVYILIASISLHHNRPQIDHGSPLSYLILAAYPLYGLPK